MHDFKYLKNDLYCEQVKVSDIVQETGTPVFIYSHKTLTSHIRKIQSAFRAIHPLICYSMKANSNLSVLKTVVNEGAGLDIVSGGELYRAKRIGCPAKKIVYAGVGKTDEEITDAIRYGILLFNVESEPELEAINRIAGKLKVKRKVNVSLRVNPGVDAHTHDHIATGKAESKFGMDLARAKSLFLKQSQYAHLSLRSLHVHIGSQIVSGEPFVEAFQKVLHFVDELGKSGVAIEYLNLGGGLGVIYDDEKPQTAAEFARRVLPLLRGRKFRLVFEPGRFVAGNAGILAGRVIYIKQTEVKNFAIVDTAMNDLIRPALYDAYHGVWPLVKKPKSSLQVYDVVGPICESGDVLARDRQIQNLKTGDAVAFMTAGAYGFVMSSN
ncbi:diaminopimelate decarboxylase, partial [Omnitrophica bacterium]|nr:diaminopimelate decarboxylase [Candidatus Omnitrophota bacterium]